jgi:hypothetical protein
MEWLFSQFDTESPFEFPRGVVAIIAGDSSILLEAALVNAVPVCCDFSSTHEDWYGFHRNGLVEYFSEPEGVCRSLSVTSRLTPSVRIKAKPHCVTVGTKYDGRSSALAPRPHMNP